MIHLAGRARVALQRSGRNGHRHVRPLTGDSQSVDDQVEWLDASNLLYFRPNEEGNFIWRLPADSGEAPHPFVREGFSPAVVR